MFDGSQASSIMAGSKQWANGQQAEQSSAKCPHTYSSSEEDGSSASEEEESASDESSSQEESGLASDG